jgi:hypothetical protein
LALTSPTSGGRSVGTVRWQTKAPEFLVYGSETGQHFSQNIQKLQESF